MHVLVAGAGIAGAATAFGLARRGVQVTVADPGLDGQATAASAGILQPWSIDRDDAFAELYQAGAAFYPELLAALADAGVTNTDHRRSGALLVHRDPEVLTAALDRVRRRAVRRPELVGAVERISPAEARRRFPPLADDLEAVWIEGGARVDGRTLRDALLEAAARHGAERHAGVVTVTERGGRAIAEVDGAEARADAVVVASGAWSAAVLDGLAVPIPVAPQRGQIVHLRVDAETAAWPTVHPLSHHYLVAFDGGRVAVGATRETGSGFAVRATAAGVRQVLDDALRIAPGLADAAVIETRVGLRPAPEGELPTVGAVPGAAGLFVATGYGAAGLTMGPLLGDALARSILGEPAPELAATAL